MHILLVAVLVALIASLLLLLRHMREQRRLLATLTRDQAALENAWNTLPAEAATLMNRRGMLISIEILNPMELASRESALAGPLGRIAPGLIQRLVYQRASEMLRKQLGEHGVQAKVRIHGLD
ncbi:hypothetical protein [Sinimarinibacterium thermocellulolyticum]|uniref:Uncharacterized protein n=1 Tax=Sinimarinibacterium thermocellulolyticum TaxID=3170016 RepID=A0ABV2A588_9GAMM